MRLNQEQLQEYEENGYLVLRNFISADSCDMLRKRAAELVEEFEPAGLKSIFTTNEQTRHSDRYFLESGDKIRFFFEEEAFDENGVLKQEKAKSLNKIGHALHDLDPVFRRFSHTEPLAELADDLGYHDPRVLQSMYIFKQPYIGGEVNCHQDATFLYTDPVTVTGFWFALEDADQGNGGLWAIPGGHHAPLKTRFYRNDAGDGTEFEVWDDSPWDNEKRVPLEVEKGTMVLLHGLLPHMSEANRSSRTRHAYTLHFIEGSASYPAWNWLRRPPEMPLQGFR